MTNWSGPFFFRWNNPRIPLRRVPGAILVLTALLLLSACAGTPDTPGTAAAVYREDPDASPAGKQTLSEDPAVPDASESAIPPAESAASGTDSPPVRPRPALPAPEELAMPVLPEEPAPLRPMIPLDILNVPDDLTVPEDADEGTAVPDGTPSETPSVPAGSSAGGAEENGSAASGTGGASASARSEQPAGYPEQAASTGDSSGEKGAVTASGGTRTSPTADSEARQAGENPAPVRESPRTSGTSGSARSGSLSGGSASGSASRTVEVPESAGSAETGGASVRIEADWEARASELESRDITLTGVGWIYLGTRGDLSCRLVSRTLSADSTLFTFLFPLPGKVDLRFLRQSLAAGESTIMTVHMTVLPAGSGEEVGDIPASDGLAEATPGDGEAVPEQPAEPEPPVPTTWGEFRTALEARDTAPFLRGWEAFLETLRNGSAGEMPPPDSLLAAADLLGGGADGPRGEILTLQTLAFLELPGGIPEYLKDGLYIRLARFYRNSVQNRDERKALEYYRKLVRECPASVYWEEADREGRYLERHYFQIR